MFAGRLKQPEPADPARYAELFQNPAFPRAARYDPAWFHQYLMGPNVLWLTESLSQVMMLEPGMRVLDMGCGSAMSSIFLAKEFGVQVWAVDLWVKPHDNWKRIVEAGVQDLVYPLHAEAHALPFAHRFFDAAVSFDAYHYFGTDAMYMPYYAAFVRDGGQIGMVVPGTAQEPGVLPSFRSPAWWSQLWAESGSVDVVHADMVPEGRDHWFRFMAGEEAWAGSPDVSAPDRELLDAPGGEHLGFTRIVATTRSTASWPA
jgi:cyclopropane fatty-acyl-phospholipid synthase-like methyltransferase